MIRLIGMYAKIKCPSPQQETVCTAKSENRASKLFNTEPPELEVQPDFPSLFSFLLSTRQHRSIYKWKKMSWLTLLTFNPSSQVPHRALVLAGCAVWDTGF